MGSLAAFECQFNRNYLVGAKDPIWNKNSFFVRYKSVVVFLVVACWLYERCA